MGCAELNCHWHLITITKIIRSDTKVPSRNIHPKKNTHLKRTMLAAICTYSLLGVTNQALADTTQTKQIPLHFIVAATDKDGANAKVDQATIEQSIENLNSHYQGTGYSYHYKSTDFVTNEEMPGFYDDDYSPDNRVLFIEPYFDKSALNVMVADFDGVNGNAFFPYFGVDGVLIDTEDLVTTTLAHEIGHNLSLLHTFADGDDEPISVQIGERGYLYGDQIIDTPPSFDDLDDDIENCEYTGSAEDEEGTPYAPDAKNIMSQGKNTCRTHFSAQQIDRMQYVLQRDKYHLFNQFGEGRTVPNCENSIIVTQFPHIDGFNFNQEIAQPWVQDVANNGFFFRTSPDSNSSRTGADEPFEGHSYLQIDSSKRDDTDFDDIVYAKKGDKLNYLSPCYDLSFIEKPTLEFYFNMHGKDMGTSIIEVSADNAQTWAELWRKEGQQHSDGDIWEKVTVDLSNYRTTPAQLRLSHIIEGEKGDASFDLFTISGTLPQQDYEFNSNTLNIAENENEVTFKVIKNSGLDSSSKIRIYTEDVDAIAGEDYTALDETLTFSSQETEKELAINIFDNNEVDGSRSFNIKLASDESDIIFNESIVTIEDNDVDFSYELGISDTQISENSGQLLVGIIKSDPTDFETKVRIKTTDDSAVGGTDFTALDEVLTFAQGETQKNITIDIIDNSEVDGSRRFTLVLESESFNEKYADEVITITNEDGIPEHATPDDKASGSVSGYFTLMLGALCFIRRNRKKNIKD
ncbi:hypothetical protein CWB79_11835 [Pseudoalteromonas sp. S1649]|nr:hypothetical protein CWB80_03730 [Pseudoalteromonas sp. S1650]TMP66548.1 hypothetical protein CWB79_11835 [Pseudoalteromonas sp. S1649]